MRITGAQLDLIANDMGKPRNFPIAVAPPPGPKDPSVVPPRPSSFHAMRWPPCELAGKWAYCQAPGGAVHRTTLGSNDTREIAKSRSGTRIAAAALGADHSVVATLESRRTSEGEMLKAFVTLDDGESQLLSDDGAGATTLRLLARGENVLATYLDTRTAMVPVHARHLSFSGKGLTIGSDAVVFVAGSPERGVDFTLAGTKKDLFLLLPIGKESTEFGMAAIPIADPPKEDVKAVWSIYPNGLDPAPIAGTLPPAEGAIWVARMRPLEAMPGSRRVLELGRLDAAGAFTTRGVIVTDKRVTDVSVLADSHGSVWIQYGDPAATWIERRVCP